MSRIVVVGAHGKIGQRIVKALAARGDTAVGVVRGTAQAERIRALGGEPVVIDLESATPAELADAVGAPEAFVFTAGAGAGSGVARKRTVDYGASVLAQEAADAVGAVRFVQVSAIGIDVDPGADAHEDWIAYVYAKRDADEVLRASALDWTILRPGGLTDDLGDGRVVLAESLAEPIAAGTVARTIPRDDVAALVVACLDEPATIGRQWEVVSGPELIDAAIDEAVAGQR